MKSKSDNKKSQSDSCKRSPLYLVVRQFKRASYMRYIYFILILTISHTALSNDGNDKSDDPWVAQFRYTNGWGKFEVIWVTSDGKAGYANLGHSPALPCQFQLSAPDKDIIITNLNKAISNPKPAPPLDEESFSCFDETRVSVNVSHKPKKTGAVGFVRRMSMMPKCNNFTVDDNLFSAATITYRNLENLPSSCKINPLKK